MAISHHLITKYRFNIFQPRTLLRHP